MGPNGSGKTTLAKHFNGLLKPSKGIVKILGSDTRRHSTAELAKYVGFVFQDPGRHITRESVWDEAIFGCKNLGLSECKAEEMLKRLSLYKYRDYPPYKLSTGEKTRLSIASALAVDPQILILDEPTTGQDEYTLMILKNIILEMKSRGKSILVVTHDADLALSIGTRLIVLLDGEIVYDGDPETILIDPKKADEYSIEPIVQSGGKHLEESVKNVD
jgi:energy-coupling factor transport system ATP-binding protein